MDTLVLKIKDIEALNKIQKKLSQQQKLLIEELAYLDSILQQLPTPEEIKEQKIPNDEEFKVKIWDWGKVEDGMEKWINLFKSLPGQSFNFSDNHDNIELERRGVIFEINFMPFYDEDFFICVELNRDGTVEFVFDPFDIQKRAKQFPELFLFKGTLREAYLLTIETMKKGWPDETFPEEFKILLPEKK